MHPAVLVPPFGTMVQEGLVGYCGRGSVEMLIHGMKNTRALYKISPRGITDPSKQLHGEALQEWTQIVADLQTSYPAASESLIWKSWASMYKKQKTCQWKDQLQFLSMGDQLRVPSGSEAPSLLETNPNDRGLQKNKDVSGTRAARPKIVRTLKLLKKRSVKFGERTLNVNVIVGSPRTAPVEDYTNIPLDSITTEDDEVMVLKVVNPECSRINDYQDRIKQENTAETRTAVEPRDDFGRLLYNIYNGISKRSDAEMHMSMLRSSVIGVINVISDENEGKSTRK
ncbi:hypothetical protein QR680_000357 [Steinernema hermaphroditum]|uniref:Uncharacterized protein n=1 Tax=Steinernema hermaphroditum TaxID=289476 RepID=A0AA39LE10_9BILA|nr:hypothetical protein QR680_000357 [Steinernema hermaphroditum]